MHITLMLLAIGFACALRLLQFPLGTQPWKANDKQQIPESNCSFVLHVSLFPFLSAAPWQRPLIAFLLPPFLLLTTATAVLCMGTQGHMLGLPVGWVGYALAIGFWGLAGGLLIKSLFQGWRSVQQLQSYPQIELDGLTGRLLDSPSLFAAQVGFWTPELVLSQGLLDTLSIEQLKAVLTHEQAHRHHRDTFWFFWLGWLRQMTAWLPHTDHLWQELLLLRELRADRWAAQHVDPLLLAESLLLVVQHPIENPDYCAAFGHATSIDRLEERINALLDAPPPTQAASQPLTWIGLLLGLTPLLTILFHS